MGWVGVGVLIATACYVLYRYPPSAWSAPESSPARLSHPDPKPEKSPAPSIQENAKTRDELKSSPEQTTSLENDKWSEDDAQTTPKATATISPPLAVPALSLDGDNAAKTIPQPNKPQANAPSSASSSSLMPPPPPPRQRPTAQQQQRLQVAPDLRAGRYLPRPVSGSSLRPPPSAAASLRVPPGSCPTSSTLAPTPITLKPSSPSRKAVLKPGYSPLDWAALTSNPNNKLRGANLPPGLIRVTPSMLKAQNGRKGTDAWTSYQGKVYNITPYLPFHPGGKGELLRGAGKDSGKLFMEIHPWVNWEAMLGECLVGILVSEHEEMSETNTLDAMD